MPRSATAPATPLLALLALVPLSCASRAPGTLPHEASAAQHETMAADSEHEATLHSGEYRPGANVTQQRCNPGGLTGNFEPCWSSVVNPTEEHRREAQRLQAIAAQHRAASQMLRDAEAHACAGIPQADRDISPFARREDIVSVEVLTETPVSRPTPRTEGAVVVFRAVPGLTSEWLQRLVDCHLARNAALGHDLSEMPYCPLVPKDVTAQVTPVRAGLAVTVRSDDPESALEIAHRAKELVRGR